MEVELDAKLDRLATLIEGAGRYLDIVAEPEPSADLDAYVTQLLKRLERLNRPLNIVRELPGAIYQINNYDYAMFQWFTRHQFKAGVITPNCLHVPQGELTPEERKQFQNRLR